MTIHEIVKNLETKYISTPSQISEFVEYSQYDTINKVEAYNSSKHISGDVDALGRDKPFFNICTSAANIWFRATKRHLKDIKVRADKEGNILASSIATILLRDWANKTSFESFLVKWGMVLATYGSAVAKFVNRGKTLDYEVVRWGTIISDDLDFENNPVIERYYKTPAELRSNKSYDEEQVEQLLKNLVSRKNLNNTNIDNKNDFVELYEIHGVFPLSFITENEKDEETYVQQMHIISYVGGTDSKNDGSSFTLVKGREDQSPYILTNLLPDPTGQRAMGKGAIELLFDAQWMTNHAQKLIKDQLDLASKIIYQTSDTSFTGRNATNSIETGDILIHDVNQPLTQVNNNSHDITSLQNLGSQWVAQSKDITSTPEAMRGGDIKSGTAYRTQQLAVNESSSLFEEMGYNKDIGITKMFRYFIIPFIKTKMDTTEEISAILDDNDIKKIDSKFVKNSVNRKVNENIINQVLNERKMVTREEQVEMTSEEEMTMQEGLSELGNQRFFKPSDIDTKTWKESINDFEWEIEIDTPSDQKDINLAMETLTNLFNTLADPIRSQYAQTEMGKFLMNKIITLTGTVSPLEIADIQAAQEIQQQRQVKMNAEMGTPTIGAEEVAPQATT